MRKDSIHMPVTAVFLAVLIGVFFQFGCDSASGPDHKDEDYSYRFDGLLVDDPNVDSVAAIAYLERNDTVYGQAIIQFNDKILCFGNGQYTLCESLVNNASAEALNIEVIDPSKFGDSIISSIPGNFEIDTSATIPAIRQKFTGDRVRLSWFPSEGSDGYVIAAVKAAEAYSGIGYSRYVEAAEGTSATFTDSAFSKNLGPDLVPDTGLYYLYVYSFTAKPDSTMSESLLPVRFPSQLEDNINERNLKGRVGSVVVTVHDSVFVVVE